MKSIESGESVFDFVQTATNSIKFQPEYPVSEELREEMVNKVLKDFKIYALDRYYEDYTSILEEFVKGFNVSESKSNGLMQNLFWWQLFYDSSKNNESSIIKDYMAENDYWLSKKPFLISWLKECNKLVPKFYFITYKLNERVFIAIDILTEETLEINVFDPHAIPPKQGQIAFGTLIPLGGGSFFPITDLYPFDFGARQEIANHIQYYYDQHIKSSPAHEIFIYVLTSMLQLESYLSIENQEPVFSENQFS